MAWDIEERGTLAFESFASERAFYDPKAAEEVLIDASFKGVGTDKIKITLTVKEYDMDSPDFGEADKGSLRELRLSKTLPETVADDEVYVPGPLFVKLYGFSEHLDGTGKSKSASLINESVIVKYNPEAFAE